MDGMYVALSAQMALEKRLDTIAQNVANMSSAGYRADEVKFEAVLAKTGADSTAFASTGETFVSRQAGPLTRTDDQLDVAVQGEGWLAIQTTAGVAYTRDGRMRVGEGGELTSLNGDPVLDVGRAPLVIDPGAGPPTIARDGMLTQNGLQVGAIGLFAIDPGAKLSRVSGSAVIPDRAATEILDFGSNGVIQGFVEGSNVNPVMEMSKLIMVTRAFDAANSMIQTADSAMGASIKALGDT